MEKEKICFRINREEKEEIQPEFQSLPPSYSIVEYSERIIDNTLAYKVSPDGKSVEGEKLKLREINIGIEEQSQIISLGDYWDAETMQQATSLFLKYKDVFAWS